MKNPDNEIHIFSAESARYMCRVELNRRKSNIGEISSMALGRDGECLFVATETEVCILA